MLKHKINYNLLLLREKHPEKKALYIFRLHFLILLEIFTILILPNPAFLQDKQTEKKQNNKNVRADKNIKNYKIRAFTATAYCLKGRTAVGGIPKRRGIVAADPRVLPFGTVININSGAYSGTYTVADTGGSVKGKVLDIWVTSCEEARRFGRREVQVDVLGKNPALVRNVLEKVRNKETINPDEYKIIDEYKSKESEITKYEKEFYTKAAEEIFNNIEIYKKAQYNPSKPNSDANDKDFLDTFYERLDLEMEFLARKTISKEEYDFKKKKIIESEKTITKVSKKNAKEVKDYNDRVNLLTKKIELSAQSANNSSFAIEKQSSSENTTLPSNSNKSVSIVTNEPLTTADLIFKWIIPIMIFLITGLTFYLSSRKFLLDKEKDSREKEGYNLQKKELELKIVQLEEQILPKEDNVIILQKY